MESDASNIELKDINKIKFKEIPDQIRVRRYLLGEMVGNLYPPVLEHEIRALRKRQEMGHE
jgi:hypothetical protein